MADETVMRFVDCPLGTRFKYIESTGSVYVILDHYGDHGCGLVARWEGVDGSAKLQGVYSAAESKDERDRLEVIIAEQEE